MSVLKSFKRFRRFSFFTFFLSLRCHARGENLKFEPLTLDMKWQKMRETMEFPLEDLHGFPSGNVTRSLEILLFCLLFCLLFKPEKFKQFTNFHTIWEVFQHVDELFLGSFKMCVTSKTLYTVLLKWMEFKFISWQLLMFINYEFIAVKIFRFHFHPVTKVKLLSNYKFFWNTKNSFLIILNYFYFHYFVLLWMQQIFKNIFKVHCKEDKWFFSWFLRFKLSFFW